MTNLLEQLDVAAQIINSKHSGSAMDKTLQNIPGVICS